MASKPVQLEVIARKEGEFAEISIVDHGFGLDIKKLKELAKKRGIKVDENNFADVLFEEGVSSAETVSMSSGRGVGLTAIRDIVLELWLVDAGITFNHGDTLPSVPVTATLAATTSRYWPVRD